MPPGLKWMPGSTRHGRNGGADIRAAVEEIVGVINANTALLREDLNRADVTVKTTPRGIRR